LPRVAASRGGLRARDDRARAAAGGLRSRGRGRRTAGGRPRRPLGAVPGRGRRGTGLRGDGRGARRRGEGRDDGRRVARRRRRVGPVRRRPPRATSSAMAELALRPGTADDYGALLALFDEAVAWMVARGQPGQWGDRPFSERPEARRRVREFAARPGLWIAE